MGPRALAFVLAAVVTLRPAGAEGEPAPVDHRAAAAHFAAGLEFVRTGAVAEALAEFRRAHELEPNFAVRYNIGQALASLGRSAEAARELRLYLDEGRDRITADRRGQVENDLRRLAESVGRLHVSANPAGASVSIDGASVGVSPLSEALELDAGEHRVDVAYSGRTVTQSVVIRGGENAEVHLDVARKVAPSQATGEITIACPIPGVVVDVDGKPVTRTGGGGPLLVPAGNHTLSFHREGYVTSDRSVAVRSGRRAAVACGTEPISPLQASHSGRLVIRPSEATARVEVDGAAPRELVPEGPHEVRVSKPGYSAFEAIVEVPAGGTAQVDAKLLPTAGEVRRYQSRASVQRTWAYALGAAGLAAGASATIVYLWNDGRHGTWQGRQSNLDAEWATLPPHSADLVARQTANDELISSIHDGDRVALGLGLGAALCLAGSAILFLGGADPTRFDAVAGGARWRADW
jgi:hypothetical protein